MEPLKLLHQESAQSQAKSDVNIDCNQESTSKRMLTTTSWNDALESADLKHSCSGQLVERCETKVRQ